MDPGGDNITTNCVRERIVGNRIKCVRAGDFHRAIARVGRARHRTASVAKGLSSSASVELESSTRIIDGSASGIVRRACLCARVYR
jgi:hypothetical protein